MIPRRTLLVAALVAPALALASVRVDAQVDARIAERLDAGTAAQVQTSIDRAAESGLPTEPLVLKALEGASKGARGPQIAAAVVRLAGQLGTARDALGRSSSSGEVVSATSALQAGIDASTLRALRAARPAASLETALAVLADLVAQDVPVDTASDAVLSLVRAGTRDDQLVAYRHGVERGIGAGIAPAAAAAALARAGLPAGLPASPGGAGTRPSGGRPPTP